jgi:hypothetical protein
MTTRRCPECGGHLHAQNTIARPRNQQLLLTYNPVASVKRSHALSDGTLTVLVRPRDRVRRIKLNRALDVLKNVRIAAPCSQPWHAMEGDDRVRFCKECKLNVYNLSDMTAKEAAALVQAREGRLCISYYMRADGSIINSNCPVGLRRIRKRVAWALISAAAVLGMALSAFASLGGQPRQDYSTLRSLKPFRQIANALDPQILPGGALVRGRPFVAGKIAPPRRKHRMLPP